MGYWSIIVPEATRNYLPNPSLETGTTGYTDYATGTAAGTRTRTLDWQKRGAYSYQVVKSSGGASDHYGFSVAANNPEDFDSGEKVTFSVDLNITAGSVVIKIEATVGGTPESTTETIVGAVAGRYDVTHTLSGNATAITAYIYITTATGTFYADGLQVENLDHATTYCDGDQAGCTWAGTKHASTSTRDARSRAGGREYNLDTYGYYVRESPGIGLPPITHLVHNLAQLPGALLRGFKVNARAFTLVATNTPATRADLHSKRKALMAVLQPDLISLEPVLLRYTGANTSTPVEIAVTYDGGLEFGAPDGFSEETPIRLIAYNPLWAEDGDEADALPDGQTSFTASFAVRRDDSVWSNLGVTFNAEIKAFAEGLDGKIYIGGNFTNAGDANGDGIVVYDPVARTISSLGTGLAGAPGVCAGLAVAPNGDIIVVGTFTAAGGVADTANIARWSVGSLAWQSIATGGANGDLLSALFDSSGNLFITGAFTTVGGVAANRIAKRTSAGTWSALGTGLGGGNTHWL